jgi:acetyl esterase/lipase
MTVDRHNPGGSGALNRAGFAYDEASWIPRQAMRLAFQAGIFAIGCGLATLPMAVTAATVASMPLNFFGDPILALTSVRLWPGEAPRAVGASVDDIPALIVFRPHEGAGNSTAVVIAPGGAYRGLAGDLEGREVADWFASRGVTAFVLRYRFGPQYLMPTPLIDAERAMRLVRAHAADFRIDPDRIGMMGFSAGGHLAALVATERVTGLAASTDPIDRTSARPDFLILAYPALSMFDVTQRSEVAYCKIMHMTSGCDSDFLNRYSPAQHVGSDTPATFIYHTADDALIPAEESVKLFLALRQAGVPAEMHLFRSGPHGSGLGGANPSLNVWPELLEAWLRGLGFLQ